MFATNKACCLLSRYLRSVDYTRTQISVTIVTNEGAATDVEAGDDGAVGASEAHGTSAVEAMVGDVRHTGHEHVTCRSIIAGVRLAWIYNNVQQSTFGKIS